MQRKRVRLQWPGHELDGKDITVQVFGDVAVLSSPATSRRYDVEIRFTGERTWNGTEVWAAPKAEWLGPWD